MAGSQQVVGVDEKKKSEGVLSGIAEGSAPESTDSNVRYAAYASRIRTILQATHRYVAYTSDIGESFRPVAHPGLVTIAYGVSWSYLIGDVAYEAWKAKLRQDGLWRPGLRPWETIPNPSQEQRELVAAGAPDWKLVAVKRAIFQSIASMGLPAFTIHSVVRYSGRAFKNIKNVRIRTYGPVGLGLAVVPALPYLFDEPVEEAVDYAFDKIVELTK